MMTAGGTCRVEEVKAPAVLFLHSCRLMRSSGEGRRGGGSGLWITAGHHSRVTFHLKKSRMPFLFVKKRGKKKIQVPARLSESRCVLRCVFCRADKKLQLNSSKLGNVGAASIRTNQLGELSHASKNATLHTCSDCIQIALCHGTASATELTPISLLLSVSLP